MLGGCSTGSLASNTGPKPPGHTWSTVRRQHVHVGEEVQFDFVLKSLSGRLVQPQGLADYCATIIGNERIECEPDQTGHFQFRHVFEDLPAGNIVRVAATAFQQRGGRDFMRIRGEWIPNDSPFEQRDRKVAGDSLTLEVYQAVIELSFVAQTHELDLETGVLRIRRGDGLITKVFHNSAGRPGYVLTGPDGMGRYFVHYAPEGRQLNPTDTTEVSFEIHDRIGRLYEASGTIDTP